MRLMCIECYRLLSFSSLSLSLSSLPSPPTPSIPLPTGVGPILVWVPALSPTMEEGSIIRWMAREGEGQVCVREHNSLVGAAVLWWEISGVVWWSEG